VYVRFTCWHAASDGQAANGTPSTRPHIQALETRRLRIADVSAKSATHDSHRADGERCEIGLLSALYGNAIWAASIRSSRRTRTLPDVEFMEQVARPVSVAVDNALNFEAGKHTAATGEGATA